MNSNNSKMNKFSNKSKRIVKMRHKHKIKIMSLKFKDKFNSD